MLGIQNNQSLEYSLFYDKRGDNSLRKLLPKFRIFNIQFKDNEMVCTDANLN